LVAIRPNVRGSTGYGRTYESLDDGHRREDVVKDIGALIDWIAAQPDLDASRVAVLGASYGGYVTLASLVHVKRSAEVRRRYVRHQRPPRVPRRK
jgi:dipeptidyl aminopeptidase/acylaminoacyl peptidase